MTLIGIGGIGVIIGFGIIGFGIIGFGIIGIW